MIIPLTHPAEYGKNMPLLPTHWIDWYGLLVGLIAWLTWRQFMGSDDNSVRALFAALATIFLSSALPSIVSDGWRENPRAIWFGGIGAGLLLVATFWKHLQPLVGERLVLSVGNAASDFRIWLALILLVWLYGAISSVVLLYQRNDMESILKNDIVPFRMALQKWVLPRRLTPEQIESIGSYLSRHEPFPINFNIIKDDEEAGSYRADIQRAFMRAGWTIFTFNYVAEQREGLTIDYRISESAHSKDPRKPRWDKLIQDAFNQAGVQIDGSSGGGGANLQQDSLSINIGKRRRDSHARFEKWQE